MDAQRLLERAAAADIVTAYAVALDSRDWTLFTSLFDENVEVDYRSLGTTYGVFPAGEWADRCRVLGAFKATHHKVSNFTFEEDAGGIAVTSYVDAAHFIEADGRMLEAYVLGVYRHNLVRRGRGWLIAKCSLTVAGHPGGKKAFDAAFAAARAAFVP
jgi:3-phenylpropionate/cinnamic acid dioxygenase small subunit